MGSIADMTGVHRFNVGSHTAMNVGSPPLAVGFEIPYLLSSLGKSAGFRFAMLRSDGYARVGDQIRQSAWIFLATVVFIHRSIVIGLGAT